MLADEEFKNGVLEAEGNGGEEGVSEVRCEEVRLKGWVGSCKRHGGNFIDGNLCFEWGYLNDFL